MAALPAGGAGPLTDLRRPPSYQFTVAIAPALHTTRFELVFSPRPPLATVPAALAQQVALHPNPAQSQLACLAERQPRRRQPNDCPALGLKIYPEISSDYANY